MTLVCETHLEETKLTNDSSHVAIKKVLYAELIHAETPLLEPPWVQ